MYKQNVTHTYNVLLALNRKEVVTYVTTYINIEDILLRDVSQAQKDKILYDST